MRGSVKASDLGQPSKDHDTMSKVRYGHVLTKVTHNVSISVNGSKLSAENAISVKNR